MACQIDSWTDTDMEERMELSGSVIHSIRSLRTTASLGRKKKSKCFIECTADTQERLTTFLDDIITLSQSETVTFSAPPAGCATEIAADGVVVHVLLKVRVCRGVCMRLSLLPLFTLLTLPSCPSPPLP